MKRNGLQLGSAMITMVSVSLLLVNRFLAALPDWAVRTTGVILMVGLIVFGFQTARMRSDNSVKG